MSDRVDLAALDALLAEASAACNELEGILEADRSPRPRADRERRGELAMDLWRIRNAIARVRGAIRHLGGPTIETTDATSRDVAPETTEAERG